MTHKFARVKHLRKPLYRVSKKNPDTIHIQISRYSESEVT